MENAENQPRSAGGRRRMSADRTAVNNDVKKIAYWLQSVRFRKALFGVSEKDVWKKIGQLNDMYTTAVESERARYDALLEQMQKQYEAALREHCGQGERHG